jgi:hypothetical protein
MATKFFQIVDRAAAIRAKDGGKVGFQNVSLNPQQVTESGHRIGPQEHGIVDKVDSVLQALIDNGVCVVNDTVVIDPPPKKAKSKVSEPAPEEAPAEEPAEEPVAENSPEEPNADASESTESDNL